MSIFCIAFGLFIIYITFKGWSINNTLTYMIGALFSIFGAAFTFSVILDNEFLLQVAVGMFVGILFGGFFVCRVYGIFSHKKSILGKYVDSNAYRSKNGGYVYAPVFEYIIDNKFYKRQSPETMSKRKLNKRYVKGNKYKIFVNPKNPNSCLIKRRLYFMDFIVLYFGLVGFYLALQAISYIVS